jgi:hypothetical protein
MSKNPGLFEKMLVIAIIILFIGTVFLPASGTANFIKTFEVTKIGSESDLECEGEIVIKRIDPGSIVTGDFTVENIGDSGSLLDWEVVEWPDFGTNWIIIPSSGENLSPEDGQIVVEVEFIAPSPEIPTYYGGVIKVVAVDNPDDNDLIAVNINVGRNRAKNKHYRTDNDYPSFVSILAIYNRSDVIEMEFDVIHEFKLLGALLQRSYDGIYKDIRIVPKKFNYLRIYKFPYIRWDIFLLDSFDEENVELRVDKFLGLFTYYYDPRCELIHLNGLASGVEIIYPE